MNVHEDSPILEESFSEEEPIHYVFDLDDTLKSTAEHYIEAKQEWASYTQRTVAPFWDADGLIDVYTDIDTERQKTQHYSKERFGGSLAIAYRAVAEHAEQFYQKWLDEESVDAFVDQHVPNDLQEDFHRIYENTDEVFSGERIEEGAGDAFMIGWDVVDKAPETYAGEGFIVTSEEGEVQGADQTLRYLAEQEDVDLHLLTAGVDEVQWPKIEGLQLYRFIPEDQMYVVQYDKSQKLQELADEHGENSVVMVGNSLSSDMEPAQRVDVGHVYFHYHDWEHERFEDGVDTTHPKFMDIQKIEEMADIHEALTADGQ